MRRTIVFAAVAVVALFWAAAARSETQPQPRGRQSRPGLPTADDATAARAAEPRYSSPAGYAPDAARTAGRLTPEQREERGFIRNAAALGRFDAEAGKLALARSHHADIRALATDLVDYQAGFSADLQHLLHLRGMALPMLENDQRKALSRLGKLSGAKFDREFTEIAARRQRDQVQLFERAAQGVADPTLKSWVERQLPMLREQLVATERLTPLGRAALARKGPEPASGPRAGVSRASLVRGPSRPDEP